MEELKRAVLRALLEEIGVLFDEDSGAAEYAEARGNAELCIKILHEIGIPEHAEPPENSVVAWGMIIPGNASPDGTGYRGRLTAIGRDLPNRLWSHTAQINACSGGGVRYGSEKSLPNR